MKLYTKTGDKGKTSLVGGRVDKDHLRVEAYGTLDEVNSFVGWAMTLLQDEPFQDIYQELQKIQHELFDCGGDLAIVGEKIPYKVKAEMVTFLEERIDAYIQEAPPLERFILPGGSPQAAALHLARTVTRRAERCIVSLMKEEKINEIVLQYVNRLSDYFFAVARVVNARLGVKDVEYERSAIVFREKEEK
ncbi:ATP:cob(I)alamin adenosyltransferase [Thermolongibacillus altinsuensis]|jgi:cob(I)alamin adenosyltransferase|uniref:Corrinoid adenosyltransferase n=1 Tax=Thermolongibacillus altinsuensis TaxID=575256 RepID=A0A4R1QKC1_9BACL|nr:cob(I)yrinic acid a,c-diamide adenosyltransferase [Thermolongibacillus altinsuensis]TCL53121.1 ATP:cob(I)alamin adenosyltransferase [Thermolongibacillus altinsuensis]GMB07824.1 ATP--cob(I)alamin adenosyltransferase [Thermolongibacillus altinsuensis]